MSKRNRPRTAAEAAHRRRRHEYRSARNSAKAEAARAEAEAKAHATEKPATARKPSVPPPLPKSVTASHAKVASPAAGGPPKPPTEG